MSNYFEKKYVHPFVKDAAAEYLSHAVILICDKGTNDSHLFLAALDTLISIVTDPICQLRMNFSRSKVYRKSDLIFFQQLKNGKMFSNVYVYLLIHNYIEVQKIIHVKCILHV